MEQVSEVEPFIGLYPVNTLFEPIDVKSPDSHRVIPGRCICPRMGPDMYRPASTIVVPSLVNVLLIGLVEDDEQLILGIVQIDFVHPRLHRFSPLGPRRTVAKLILFYILNAG